MRFDYLHAARPVFLSRLLEAHIPERFHAALFALAGAMTIVCGAWSIEACRLREAAAVQAVYELRYDRAQTALAAQNVYYERVRAAANLDRGIRRIAASGDADARMLAEIANDLPAHAWLTGISHQDDGLALSGQAKDLIVLGAVMHRLMHAKNVHSPRLVNATLDKPAAGLASINYLIHLDEAAR